MPPVNGSCHGPNRSASDVPTSNTERPGHDGVRDPLSFEPFLAHFADLQHNFKVYLETWADESRLRIESLLVGMVCAVAAGFAGGVMLITAVVLLLQGLAGAVAALTGSIWSGQLLVGLTIVTGTAVGIWLLARRRRMASLARLVRKYEGSPDAESRVEAA